MSIPEIHNSFIRICIEQFLNPRYPSFLEELLLPKRDFEKILLEAVDEGLSSLGQSSRRAIYFYLEKSFNVKKQEIPSKIEVFADAIEKIFGSGADFLEILIMKRLHEKISKHGLKVVEKKSYGFSGYIEELKEKCGC